MDLLNNNMNKKEENKAKKLILLLICILIIILLIIIIMMTTLKSKKIEKQTFMIDDNAIEIKEEMIIINENKQYVSLSILASNLGYNYLRGGYSEYEENTNECYLENNKQIIGFKANSNTIYKTTSTSTKDYQYYELNNKIIKNNEILYIALEDLNTACNVMCIIDGKKINIYTADKLINLNIETFAKKDLTISQNEENKKAIAYNMIVVTNQNSKMGVVNLKGNVIIGNKYTTIEFNEKEQNFIVSNAERYGIISKDGNVVIELKYEGLKVINYQPMLYQIKLNNKYGILNDKGKIIVNPIYDKIGYTERTSTREPALIIKDIDGKNGIVVCSNNKYGIIDIENGATIMPCTVDKIYFKIDDERKKHYYVELQNTEIDIQKYIDYINTSTVVTN